MSRVPRVVLSSVCDWIVRRPLSRHGRLGRRAANFVEPSVTRLLRRTLLSYGAHAFGIYAGALAFFAVLALFPLLLLLGAELSRQIAISRAAPSTKELAYV